MAPRRAKQRREVVRSTICSGYSGDHANVLLPPSRVHSALVPKPRTQKRARPQREAWRRPIPSRSSGRSEDGSRLATFTQSVRIEEWALASCTNLVGRAGSTVSDGSYSSGRLKGIRDERSRQFGDVYLPFGAQRSHSWVMSY
jgi:hypothetical protein